MGSLIGGIDISTNISLPDRIACAST